MPAYTAVAGVGGNLTADDDCIIYLLAPDHCTIGAGGRVTFPRTTLNAFALVFLRWEDPTGPVSADPREALRTGRHTLTLNHAFEAIEHAVENVGFVVPAASSFDLSLHEAGKFAQSHVTELTSLSMAGTGNLPAFTLAAGPTYEHNIKWRHFVSGSLLFALAELFAYTGHAWSAAERTEVDGRFMLTFDRIRDTFDPQQNCADVLCGPDIAKFHAAKLRLAQTQEIEVTTRRSKGESSTRSHAFC